MSQEPLGDKNEGFKLGRMIFSILEPFWIFMENLRPSVRRYFDRAIQELERKNMGLALFNLNIVLDLKPNHFLARVYRGRIHLRQKRFSLAMEDFVQANTISSFRFEYYNLYEEYLESMHQEGRVPLPIFDKGYAHDLEGGSIQEGSARYSGREEEEDYADTLSGKDWVWESESSDDYEGTDLTCDEEEKFQQMGPITGSEIKETDWDQVLRKLIS